MTQSERYRTAITLLLDLATILLSSALVYFYHDILGDQHLPRISFVWFTIGSCLIWPLTYAYFKLYAMSRASTWSTTVVQLVKAHLVSSIAFCAWIFLLAPPGIHRAITAWFLLTVLLLSLIVRLGLHVVSGLLRRRGYDTCQLLVFGGGIKAHNFISILERHPEWGYRISGILNRTPIHTPLEGKYRNLGCREDLLTVCMEQMIDEVVFCLSASEFRKVETLATGLNEMGITSRMVLDYPEYPCYHRVDGMFHGYLPMTSLYARGFRPGQVIAKRCLDLGGSLAGLALFGIMLPVVALAVRVESSGPLFIGQDRIGLNGRPFRFWKMRTRYSDGGHQSHRQPPSDLAQFMNATHDDPGRTTVGRFLRRTRLDEFPQFWNVLKGEMSLVGTRPPKREELARYADNPPRRIPIKPGITGLWQIPETHQIQDFDEVTQLDLQYIDSWSIWSDLRIMLKTIIVIISGR